MPRRLLILPLLVALSGPALAQDYVTQITGQLRDQGFGRIDVERTLLGRSRIIAQSGDGTREIIVNPRTGEILRDLWQPVQGNGAGRVLAPDPSGGKGADADRRDNSGSDNTSADANDDDDDSRADDSGRDNDDNSGKGTDDTADDDDTDADDNDDADNDDDARGDGDGDGNSGKDDGASETDGSDDGGGDDD